MHAMLPNLRGKLARKRRRAVCLVTLLGCLLFVVVVVDSSSRGGPSLVLPGGDEQLSSLEGSIRYNNLTATLHSHINLPPLAIFYHIYMPPDHEQAQKAREIIHEQIHDLGRALSSTPNLPTSTLYYTSVGEEIQEDHMNSICQDYPAQFRSCQRLKHIATGFEEHTLQELFEYCQEYPDHRVIYLHTKGSYHGSSGQNRWRRHMTDAVASPECIARGAVEDCDLCGLLFMTRPAHHFTGNMFNAKCSYIRRLIPPFEFEARMNRVHDEVRKLVDMGTLTATMFDLNAPWNVGTQRYAMEHWHGSHPSLEIVCDVATNPDRRFWKSLHAEDRKPEDWEFHRFPRRPLPDLPSALEKDVSRRKREYFLLPGLVFKWSLLYGDLPGQSSWIWTFYPDGPFWRDQVEKYGLNAIKVVVKGLT